MRKLLLEIAFVLFGLSTFAQEDVTATLNKAGEEMGGKNYAVAYELFNKALSNPGDLEIQGGHYFNAAYCAEQANKYEAAIKYYDKAISVGANASTAKSQKAGCLVELGEYDEALAVDEKEAPKLSYRIAASCYKAKDYEGAYKYFTNAKNLNYEVANSVYYSAVALEKLGKDAECKELLKTEANNYPETNITKKLAIILSSEGVDAYKVGAGIITEANNKVNAGAFTTEDDAYKTALKQSSDKMKEALTIFEEVLKLDASNTTATKYIEACKAAM